MTEGLFVVNFDVRIPDLEMEQQLAYDRIRVIFKDRAGHWTCQHTDRKWYRIKAQTD